MVTSSFLEAPIDGDNDGRSEKPDFGADAFEAEQLRLQERVLTRERRGVIHDAVKRAIHRYKIDHEMSVAKATVSDIATQAKKILDADPNNTRFYSPDDNTYEEEIVVIANEQLEASVPEKMEDVGINRLKRENRL